jgi:hypothetical protein
MAASKVLKGARGSKVAVRIGVGSTNWHDKAMKAINQKKRVLLAVTGPQAAAAAAALRTRENQQGAVPIVLAAAIIVGVIAVVGMGVLAAVCLFGMHKGYNVKARQEASGAPFPFNIKLIFELVPPAR